MYKVIDGCKSLKTNTIIKDEEFISLKREDGTNPINYFKCKPREADIFQLKSSGLRYKSNRFKKVNPLKAFFLNLILI